MQQASGVLLRRLAPADLLAGQGLDAALILDGGQGPGDESPPGRRSALTGSIVSPAKKMPLHMEGAAVMGPDGHVQKGAFRRRGLAQMVVSPALDRSV
jgi:hypothetical protein